MVGRTIRPMAGTDLVRAPSRGVWWLRRHLPAPARRAVRNVTDPVLYPVGSLRSVNTSSKIVALTFDDGPDPVSTGSILDVLRDRGASATFFVLADQASASPWLISRQVEEEHEVGLHGWDHTRLTRLSARDAAERMRRGRDRIRELSGRPVRWFRPPFGSQSVSTYMAARRLGLMPVVWTRDAADWEDDHPEEIARRALAGLEPGGIILFHDGLRGDPGEPTPDTSFDRAAAVGIILDGLARRGFQAVSVGRLIERGRPHRTAWFRP